MCAPCKVNVRCQAASASIVHANSSLCKSGQATVLVTLRPPSCGLRKASHPSPWKYVLRLARASWSSGNVHCTPCTGPRVERGRQKQVHTSWPANWLARAEREQQTGRPRMVLVTAVKKKHAGKLDVCGAAYPRTLDSQFSLPSCAFLSNLRLHAYQLVSALH